MSDFDADEFLDWLEEKDAPINADVMEGKWPDFPWEYCVSITGTFVDGNGDSITDLGAHDGEVHMGYYKRDLRRAARKQKPVD